MQQQEEDDKDLATLDVGTSWVEKIYITPQVFTVHAAFNLPLLTQSVSNIKPNAHAASACSSKRVHEQRHTLTTCAKMALSSGEHTSVYLSV